MLIPGIKFGQRDWQEKIAAHPHFAEIWYRVDQAEKYPVILTALQQQNIPFGLHFWGITSSGHEPNVCYPGKDLSETIELMKRCLEHAADWQASYVNIHSGNRGLININFDQETMEVDPTFPLISDKDAGAVRTETLNNLGRFAHQCNVALLVESIPAKVAGGGWHSPDGRLRPVDTYPASLTDIQDLCDKRLVGFTNDFCHTYAIEFDQPREQLVSDFAQITNNLLRHTYLCHVNTLTPPYNGTDEHHGILPADLNQSGVFPNQTELINLLHRYSQLPHDVYLVGEPMKKHIENYQELVRLISQL